MTRQPAEFSNALSVFFLKKDGYFSKDIGIKQGTISWTYGSSKNSIDIYLVAETEEKEGYINLNYTINGEIKMNYNITLTTTPCNFGGKRYWFICPLTKNGKYCGKRVGVIYNYDRWFGCRHCCNVAYNSQFQGKRFRYTSVCQPDVDKAYEEIGRFYYKGKPTRKYRRYMRLRNSLDNAFYKVLGKDLKI